MSKHPDHFDADNPKCKACPDRDLCQKAWQLHLEHPELPSPIIWMLAERDTSVPVEI